MKQLDELGEQAVASQGTLPPPIEYVRRAASKRRTRRNAMIGAAVVVPLVVAVGLFAGFQRDETRTVAVAASVPVESPNATDPTCGENIPFDPLVLPVSSSSGETSTTPEPDGTLVTTSRVGAIEIVFRWPARSYTETDWAEPSFVPTPAIDGDGWFSIDLAGPGNGPPFPGPLLFGSQPDSDDVAVGCEVVEIMVNEISDSGGSTVLAHFGWDLTSESGAPVDLRPLIVQTGQSKFEIPDPPVDCVQANDGSLAVDPVRSDQIFDSPEAALEAFVNQAPEYPTSGYSEFVLNTGVHVYSAVDSGVVSPPRYPVVMVEPTNDGWQATGAGQPVC